MISLVEHAADDRAPAATAWVLTGSVAVALVGLVGAMWAVRDFARLPSLYGALVPAMLLAAGAALLVGWARPAPWALVLLMVAVLSAPWWVAVDRWLRLEDPSSISPNAD